MPISWTPSRRNLLRTGAALGAASLLPRVAHAREESADVIVIGAGLSGLNAASILANEGYAVSLIEARGRLGGRIESLRSVEGEPELGGDSILGGYGRMQDTARRLGVEIIDHAGRRDLSPEAQDDPKRVELVLDGKVVPLEEWSRHPRNAMPEDAKSRFPGRGYFQSVIGRHNPLESFEQWFEPESAQYDESVYDFFKRVGWSDEAIELNYNTNVQYGTSAHDISILMWYYVQAWFRLQSDIDRVAFKATNGNQSIPEAMAAALPREPHLGKPVIGIRNTPKGVEVHCEDGSIFRGRRVICSAPIPTLRWIDFDPMPSPAFTKAVATVPVMKITKVVMVPKTPFWEKDGLSPAMWTDGIAGEIRAQREGEDPNKVTSLLAWARGALADRLDAYGEEGAKRAVIAAYEQARPAAKDQLEAVAVKSWQRDPFALGDWAVWKPGQIHSAFPALMSPEGHVHFCGEHTALTNRGMEGAMESGERAAFEVMDVL